MRRKKKKPKRRKKWRNWPNEKEDSGNIEMAVACFYLFINENAFIQQTIEFLSVNRHCEWYGMIPLHVTSECATVQVHQNKWLCSVAGECNLKC